MPSPTDDPPPVADEASPSPWPGFAAEEAEIVALLEAWEPPEGFERGPFPSKVASWGRSSLLGGVMTGWALGLKEVLETEKDDRIVIEVDADGEPHDLPIRLLLDPDDPRGSLCIVRRDPPDPVV